MSERAVLKLSLSQSGVSNPFVFKDSKFKLYTFEELIYHMYHYSGDSIDEFTSTRLFNWIQNELRLPEVVARIERLLNTKESVVQSYISFLQSSDLFSAEEIYQLKQNLFLWETRTKWDKLKEKGDRALNKREFENAASIYEEALKSIEDPFIFNNLGVAYMNLSQYSKAEAVFHEAQLREPNHIGINLNIVELYITQNRYTLAEKYLIKAKTIDETNPLIPYFTAQIELLRNNKEAAYNALQVSTNILGSEAGILLANLYLQDMEYEKAEGVLKAIPCCEEYLDYYMILAQVYEKQCDYHKAKDTLLSAQISYPQEEAVAVALTKIYKQLAEYEKAAQLVEEMFKLKPEDDSIRLELARIRKLNGKVIDYENMLKEILFGLRERIRSNTV